MSSRKFGIIFCEDLEKWGGVEGGRPLLTDMFCVHPHDEWDYFKATLNDLPAADKLNEYQAFILSGSHYSANDDLPWVRNLETFLKAVFEYQKTNKQLFPKLVGICFGHQIMAKALGAKVIKNEYGKFVFGFEKINVADDLKGTSCFKDMFSENESSFVLIASHSEEVDELPPSAKSVAFSSRCRNEVVLYSNGCHGDIGGLSFQGHMEITTEQALTNILPTIKKAGLYSEEEEEKLKNDLLVVKNQRKEIVDVIKNFISSSN